MASIFFLNLLFILFTFCVFMIGCNTADEGHGRGLSSPVMVQKDSVVPLEWKPAVFKGLTIGIASRKESIDVLGTPRESTESRIDLPPNEEPELQDEYPYQDDFPGSLVVSSSKKTETVTSIIIYPDDLRYEDLLDIYGKDFVLTKYSLLDCPNDAGSGFVREAKDGEIEFLEYRAKGIVVDLDDEKHLVKSIEFVQGPVETRDCSSSQ